MRKTPLSACLFLILIGFLTVSEASGTEDAVDLQWWPEAQVVQLGASVEVGLYAVPNVQCNWPVSAMDVIVFHSKDGTGTPHLAYQGLIADGAPYDWFFSGLSSKAPDGINADKYDGEIMYTAMAEPGEPAVVPSSGLLVTTFRFTAQTVVAESTITIPATFGLYCTTAVWDGVIANKNVVGQRGSARVMVVPQNVQIKASVVGAKSLNNETEVALTGPIVTRSFSDYFYIEDEDRVSGIRVNNYGQTQPDEGSRPMIWGVVRVVDGERILDNAVVGTGGIGSIPRPLGMNCSALFKGLHPQGLLIRLSGRADSVQGAPVFFLNDGSPDLVRVELHGFGAPPDQAFVTATGVLGADENGPVLRVRHASDITIEQQ